MLEGTEGPDHAKVMLIGECWGSAEDKAKLPFQGLAGRVLNDILDEVGLPRGMCRITNVIHRRPSNNNFAVFYEKGKPTPELLEAYERLNNEIVACNPNLIVTLGNEAMKAVLGFYGVMDWRGSVLPSRNGIKVIPTIHPAAVLREWTYRPPVVSDFKKALKEKDYAQINQTRRETVINPSLEEVLRYIDEAKKSDYCAFDIETESNQITCIGLSCRLNWALCIPFWVGASGSVWSEQEEQLIWIALKDLLESDYPKKIAHNGMYELEFLTRTVGIRPKIHFDTMLAFHTLYSELPKSLAYLVSVYTDHPYYKFHRKTNDKDELWVYNATDVVLTYECAVKLFAELEESKQRTFYDLNVHSLIDPLFSMNQRGVKFDSSTRGDVRKAYEQELTQMQQDLNSRVGHELNIASHKQMTTWLYEELKLPQKTKLRKATGNETLAADEDVLEDLYAKHKIEAIALVIQMRKKTKLLSTYLNVRLDDDGRIRCSYNIAGTETGRLSSSTTAFGTGTNLQNIPDGIIRSMFVADDGYLLVNADLSQAEARVVAYLSGDARLIEVFSNGGDIHKRNASMMFNVSESQVTDEQRFLAKRAVHGLNYGMGPITFAQQTGITTEQARKVYNAYFTAFPRVKIWHMQTKDRLNKQRYLVNPYGRKRLFFNKWSDSLLKEGLAFIPQSTVADMVNQAIIHLYSLWNTDERKQLLLQVHDSILAQVKEEALQEAVKEVKEAMTRPIEVNGKILVIPVDVKVGKDWSNLEKYPAQSADVQTRLNTSG